MAPIKDREIELDVEENVRILYLRSSVRPIQYAVLLQVRGLDGWKTRVVADNSHEGQRRRDAVGEHHLHRFVGNQKQIAEPLPFAVSDTNDAMRKIIEWFTDQWEELV